MLPFVPTSHFWKHLVQALTVVAVTLSLTASGVQAQDGEIPLGSTLPSSDVSVQTGDGDLVSMTDLLGERGTVILFWSNQCPWVDKYESRVQELADAFGSRGVAFVRVNSNDPAAFPKEALDPMRERVKEEGYDAPYVRDPNAELARALGASRTPHVFVFDDTRTLIYAGTIDDSPADPSAVRTHYLRDAVQTLVEGGAVPIADTKAFGCMIKFPS